MRPLCAQPEPHRVQVLEAAPVTLTHCVSAVTVLDM
jgi:hypothetical protein